MGLIGICLISLVLPLGLAGPAGRAMQEAAKHMTYRAEARAAGLAERVRRTTDPPNCTDSDGAVWPEGEGDNCTTYTGFVTDTRCIGWINGEDFTNITTSAPDVSRDPSPYRPVMTSAWARGHPSHISFSSFSLLFLLPIGDHEGRDHTSPDPLVVALTLPPQPSPHTDVRAVLNPQRARRRSEHRASCIIPLTLNAQRF